MTSGIPGQPAFEAASQETKLKFLVEDADTSPARIVGSLTISGRVENCLLLLEMMYSLQERRPLFGSGLSPSTVLLAAVVALMARTLLTRGLSSP